MGFFFIIVLDKNSTGPEGDWFVTASAETLAQLLARPQTHNDKFYRLPKSLFPGEHVQEIALWNVPLQKADQGDIYKVPHHG